MAKLNTFVHVHKDGESHVFGPDDTLPAWAVKAITNDAVWDEPPTEEASEEDETPTKPQPRKRRAKGTSDDETPDESPDDETPDSK